MHSIRRFASILTVLLIFPTAALAQGTADIVGRVTDTSGGVLPAVTVTAENAATKISRTTITSDTGDYTFTLLPIGSYSVKIELSGFQTVNARVDLAPMRLVLGPRISAENHAEGPVQYCSRYLS